MRLEAGTVLLQWSVGGLFFLWVTTRRRDVGIGYGWLLRATYLALALAAAATGRAVSPGKSAAAVRDAGALATAVAASAALVVSVVRRRAGVRGEHERRAARAERVAAMAGRAPATEMPARERGREFPPALDLVAPACGVVGIVAATVTAGGPTMLALARLVAGSALLGCVSDAMLLGHWYLVQPGLDRGALQQLVRTLAAVTPFEVAALLWPTGMVQVFTGTIDDGWHGLLGWIWLTCAVTTLALAFVVRLALRERYYSAVMSATGLLYLAILTAFGTDLVARAVLA
jgi:hypothetical protein